MGSKRHTFDVVTLGTATSDMFITGKEFRTVRDPQHLEKLGFPTGEAECLPLGAKIEIDPPIYAVGGGAANAAVTFARAGLKTGAVVSIGEDEHGQLVCARLRREKVRVSPLWDRGSTTATSVILLSKEGERTILAYRGASQDVTAKKMPAAAYSTRWVYVAPGHIPPPAMLDILRKYRATGTKIAINPSQFYMSQGFKKLEPLLKLADVVILNREEAASLTGVKFEEAQEVFRKFSRRIKGFAVMTDGERGSVVSDGTRIFAAKVFPTKKEKDATGAGDAFGSGFVAALIQEKGLSNEAIIRALRFAAANATSVVEQVGAQAGILRLKEFEEDRRWKKFEVKIGYLKK